MSIQGYILTSVHEKNRQQNVAQLEELLPALERVEAIYPRFEKIPFAERIKTVSLERTGHALMPGEIGCLLSHRKIWMQILRATENENEMFLVLESDGRIKNINILQEQYNKAAADYDLFFWGAWEGHMRLLRSTRQRIDKQYTIGEPFIKSVYCTYGYSVNKKAAAYLLKQTRKVHYPVDQFKRFIGKGDLRIGGVAPELVTTLADGSYIKDAAPNQFTEYLFRKILDLKNELICLFR